MGAKKRRRADRFGRPPMPSPGRPPEGRREHRQRFWDENKQYDSTSTFVVASLIVQNIITRGKDFALKPQLQRLLDTQQQDVFDREAEILSFGVGMSRPQWVAGPRQRYTAEALERGGEGLMIAKCVVTIEVAIRHCRITKPVALVEEESLRALYCSRYSPVMFQGKSIQVDYTFNLKLVKPRD